MMRRVVVTGLGLVTPLGCGVQASWTRLLAGESGAATITRFDASDHATNYACEVPLGSEEGCFNPDDWMEPRERRKVGDFILYGVAAAQQAIEDSGWQPASAEERRRTGVMIGSGIGGIESIAQSALLLRDRGPKRISPFFIPGALINLVSGHVSIRFGLTGPNHSVATACATGAHAIGDAARLIEYGDADVMVAGGTESPISAIGVAGFNACRALSTAWREEPSRASRPFDEARDGFVMGEGAGVVILEDHEHAARRGARILAEIAGYGLSGDAHHITAPSPDGAGGGQAMRAALGHAHADPTMIDYVNMHGTSTMADVIELGAVTQLMGDHASRATLSSTKSAIGHLLGAAGAVEAILCILAIRDQVVPPTINLDHPVPEASGIDLAPNVARPRSIDLALSNSFGFGGSNACLAFRKWTA